ncbi:MAG: prenyltransferase/squalene oxidase repeat-containing protein [Thermomicrobiales bacterium]
MDRHPVVTTPADGRWTISRRLFVGGALGAVAAFNLLDARAATPVATSPKPTRLAKTQVLKAGAAWLQARQDAGGGFADMRGTIDLGVTAEIVTVLVALRNVGVAVKTDEAVGYLRKHAKADVGQAAGGDGKVVVALVAGGADPRKADGVDLVARVIASWHEATGTYGTTSLDNAFALMALAVTGEKIPDLAIKTLATSQNGDGSWAFGAASGGGSGDSNTTAFMIEALVATGHRADKAVGKAVEYLRSTRSANGGFGLGSGAPSDANSTAFVITALTAAGEKLKSKEWSGAPASLAALQNEGGAFRYTDAEPGDDLLATIGALLALSGAAEPVLPKV